MTSVKDKKCSLNKLLILLKNSNENKNEHQSWKWLLFSFLEACRWVPPCHGCNSIGSGSTGHFPSLLCLTVTAPDFICLGRLWGPGSRALTSQQYPCPTQEVIVNVRKDGFSGQARSSWSCGGSRGSRSKLSCPAPPHEAAQYIILCIYISQALRNLPGPSETTVVLDCLQCNGTETDRLW